MIIFLLDLLDPKRGIVEVLLIHHVYFDSAVIVL